MLEHTLDRADKISGLAHTVTVIARSHRQEAGIQFGPHSTGIVVEQPLNRDTAAGVFLPLAFIRARDPQATVVIYPSDHFVYPEERFVRNVQRAVFAAECLTEKIVLLGVPPDGIELDYGWIRPGKQLDCPDGCTVRSVEGFCEKPGLDQAKAAFQAGALWNTLILAAKIDTLWRLGWSCIPEIMVRFEILSKFIGTADQQKVLDEIYCGMPKRNFSSDLLTVATRRIAVIAMENVLWSDWGRPERIVDTLSGMGKAPAFPLRCLAGG